MRTTKTLLLFALTILVLSPERSVAAPQQQESASEVKPMDDPITQLNLSPEQLQKIRAVRAETQDERAAANERFRQANRALEEALDSDNPDEALVEQRLRDVAAAQAAQMRMRVLTEVRIRRILTPEQQGVLRALRQQARRERRLENMNAKRPAAILNRRNGLAPMLRGQGGVQRRRP